MAEQGGTMRGGNRCIAPASLFFTLLLVVAARPVFAAATPLPPLRDGSVITGPGQFEHDGVLQIHGSVTLRQLDLDLRGPIHLDTGARLVLDHVRLRVSDPPGSPNGTSGLNCAGPAEIDIRDSEMTPVGSAHPMWEIRGRIDVRGFRTLNSEFHLYAAHASLHRLRIFELQLHPGTDLEGSDLDLVFLSDYLEPGQRVQFSDIPANKWFSRTLHLGGGAIAKLTHARAQIFLLYIQKHSDVTLAHLGRVQLALFPQCNGSMRLPRGRLGSARTPAIFPDAQHSDCSFHLSLNDVYVDTWDVYTGGHAHLTFDHSYIDELGVTDNAQVTVRNSVLFADWLAVGGEARVNISDSRVGALGMVAERPDLATSQVHVLGDAQVRFDHVRFDCGVYAGDHAKVIIADPRVAPKYIQRQQQGSVQMLSPVARQEQELPR